MFVNAWIKQLVGFFWWLLIDSLWMQKQDHWLYIIMRLTSSLIHPSNPSSKKCLKNETKIKLHLFTPNGTSCVGAAKPGMCHFRRSGISNLPRTAPSVKQCLFHTTWLDYYQILSGNALWTDILELKKKRSRIFYDIIITSFVIITSFIYNSLPVNGRNLSVW